MTSPHFFSDGIRFTCTDCGQCCSGAPGVVSISDKEIETLAAHLAVDQADLHARYLTTHEKGWRIREKENGDCIFFDGRCTIYPARPRQCRTYPFWFKNLRSKEAWHRTCANCPGIGQGRLYSEAEILALIDDELADRPAL